MSAVASMQLTGTIIHHTNGRKRKTQLIKAPFDVQICDQPPKWRRVENGGYKWLQSYMDSIQRSARVLSVAVPTYYHARKLRAAAHSYGRKQSRLVRTCMQHSDCLRVFVWYAEAL